ncbi:MAG TPA: glycosyl transferase [Candidatus Fimimorpha excrementavium]|nr:glycosyl transferase [Candidatus Fimimorpha excrementavium]
MVNLPFSGHTTPTLGLAKVLVDLGHHVCYINASDWKEKIEKTGAVFLPYDNYPETLSPSQKEIKSWFAAYQTVQRVGADFDCLIYEMLFLPGKALADQLNIPAFRLFSTFTLNEKVLRDFGRTGGWYMTAIFRYPRLCRLLSKVIQKKFGLRYGDISKEMVHNAPSLNFTYTIRDFQIYPDEFPAAHYKYVGPAMEDRAEQDFDFSQMTTPIIYISLGTLLNTSAAFFRKCIDAFRDESVSVIISLGKTVKKEQLGEIPANIFIYPFVPQLKILKRASLFITHGGMNSVNEALYYGTPMLVIPVGNDQPRVAQQIEDLHLGRYLKKKPLTPDILKDNAKRVLQDMSYKEHIIPFQKKFQAARGNAAIAEMILDALSQKGIPLT